MSDSERVSDDVLKLFLKSYSGSEAEYMIAKELQQLRAVIPKVREALDEMTTGNVREMQAYALKCNLLAHKTIFLLDATLGTEGEK